MIYDSTKGCEEVPDDFLRLVDIPSFEVLQRNVLDIEACNLVVRILYGPETCRKLTVWVSRIARNAYHDYFSDCNYGRWNGKEKTDDFGQRR
jgi:hypothetical protein